MKMRPYLAVLMLCALTPAAYADHAIDTAPDASTPHASSPSAASEPETSGTPETSQPAAAGEPVTTGQSETGVASEPEAVAEEPALIPAAMRETCRTMFWGGEIRTDCRTEAIPARAPDPALRGICITAYGRRTCY